MNDAKRIEAWKTLTLLGVVLDGDDLFLNFAEKQCIAQLEAEGDCCAHAFFTDLDVATSFPCKITGWEDVEGDTEDIDYGHGEIGFGDVRDTCFVKIKTTKGYIDVTLHTDHNGYYGGWYNVIG